MSSSSSSSSSSDSSLSLLSSSSSSSAAFFTKLSRRITSINSLLCVGLDPHVCELPTSSAEASFSYCARIVSNTQHVACCYKPNIAFFQVFGAAGMEVLSRLIALIPPTIPVLLDCKIGDIDRTAKAYASAYFDVYGVDGLTVNPYMGRESLEPFLNYSQKAIFVLCKTSNPGSNDYQTLLVRPYSRLNGAQLNTDDVEKKRDRESRETMSSSATKKSNSSCTDNNVNSNSSSFYSSSSSSSWTSSSSSSSSSHEQHQHMSTVTISNDGAKTTTTKTSFVSSSSSSSRESYDGDEDGKKAGDDEGEKEKVRIPLYIHVAQYCEAMAKEYIRKHRLCEKRTDLCLVNGVKGNNEEVEIRGNDMWDEGGGVGLVVGATDVEAMRDVRRVCPNMWLLSPGIGFQGGDLRKCLMNGLRKDGKGILVSISSGISKAEDMKLAAEKFSNEINEIREEFLSMHETSNVTAMMNIRNVVVE